MLTALLLFDGAGKARKLLHLARRRRSSSRALGLRPRKVMIAIPRTIASATIAILPRPMRASDRFAGRREGAAATNPCAKLSRVVRLCQPRPRACRRGLHAPWRGLPRMPADLRDELRDEKRPPRSGVVGRYRRARGRGLFLIGVRGWTSAGECPPPLSRCSAGCTRHDPAKRGAFEFGMADATRYAWKPQELRLIRPL